MAFDPNYSSVSLLLHGDGVDGSTTIADHSPTPQAVTAIGSAHVSTAQSKFGGASLLLTSGSLTAASFAGLGFGTGDFTIEFWIMHGNNNVTVTVIRITHSGIVSNVQLECPPGGAPAAVRYVNYGALKATSAFSVTSSTWTHCAIVRASGQLNIYIGGVGGTPVAFADDLHAAGSIVVGGNEYGQLIGNIDDLRITKGVARYTADFSPPVEAFPNEGPSYNAYISVGTILSSPVALAQTVAIASAKLPAIIGAPALFASSGHVAFAVAPSPMGHPSAVALAICGAYAQAPTPLAAPSVLAEAAPFAKIAVGTPLQQPKVLAVAPYFAHALAPSPMRAPQPLAWHDFTGQIGDTATRYVMDLITPSGTVRVPISSWQATLRSGSSSYVQCVIPAAQQWGAAINAATSFRIYRRAVTTSGQVIEYLMAEAPAFVIPPLAGGSTSGNTSGGTSSAGYLVASPQLNAQFDRGPKNHTCTLSRYVPRRLLEPNTPPRSLTGIRSISSGASYRVRCAIDWLLRPGQRGVVDGVPFVVEWINYYVNTTDAYMEVGT